MAIKVVEEGQFNITCNVCRAVLALTSKDVLTTRTVTFFGVRVRRFFRCPICKNFIDLPDVEVP